ncbi:class I SAM-dependent methyltransferase [Pseudomonadales bacterium]|nr:class I SAM-dependent methyltransferase [Pseudomonadales bacterium]
MVLKNRGIFETLARIGVATKEAQILYANGTRDVESLKVYKDLNTGVIYIDDFYTGEETNTSGAYRLDGADSVPDYERKVDADRRIDTHSQFYAGKDILDFGCGAGDFLKLAQPYCNSVVGVELQSDYITELKSYGIKCLRTLDEIEDESLDVIFSFHVIEHLEYPIDVLNLMRRKLRTGGKVVIEVPHANDLLLGVCHSKEFQKFTLWSQHLVLHARESLRRLLSYCEYEQAIVEGCQRYPLSNHLFWLAEGLPGGHKSIL